MLQFVQISTRDKHLVSALRQHYTGSRGAPYGKKLAWAAVFNGNVIAYFGLGEPSYKLAARRNLGLQDARPAPYTVSNWLFRRISVHGPKGSELIRTWHEVAANDWQHRYGWRPIHWETMVQADAVMSEVPGAAYRRAGYRHIGSTTGRSARRPKGHSHGPRVWMDAPVKMVFYRGPLARMGTRQGDK